MPVRPFAKGAVRAGRLRSARAVACASVLALLLGVGCDRRLEPWVDASAEPPPPERPVRVPGLEAPVARSQPLVDEPRGLPAPGAGAPIRGELRLAPGESAPGGVLFLIARSAAAGPPLAVQRLPVGPFPLAFEIGPADVMLQGMPFAGPIRLSARVDRDGDPLTRDDVELGAALAQPVEPGSEGVELVLRTGGAR